MLTRFTFTKRLQLIPPFIIFFNIKKSFLINCSFMGCLRSEFARKKSVLKKWLKWKTNSRLNDKSNFGLEWKSNFDEWENGSFFFFLSSTPYFTILLKLKFLIYTRFSETFHLIGFGMGRGRGDLGRKLKFLKLTVVTRQ